MSIWRRAVRVARSNLNDIARRASDLGGGGRSLEAMSDDELSAELERRRRSNATRAAVDQAFADRAAAPPPQGQRAKDLAGLSPQKRRKVRQYYANLELPFGADLSEVKKAYRRLMSKYHPDKHQADPARRQLATQLSQKLTVAYNELSILLKEPRK